MDNVKLLIVDDTVEIQTAMYNYYSQMDQIEVVGVAGNGMDAMTLTQKSHPDVVVLDIVMPHNDGLGYLESWRQIPGDKPNVIVVSALRDHCVKRALDMGACYYVIKPFDYKELYYRILDFGRTRPVFYEPNLFTPSRILSVSELNVKTVEDQIGGILLGIGIPPQTKGFSFLQKAVYMVMDNWELIKGITKELYPAIAKHFGVPLPVVERAMRHAITTAWQRGGANNMNQFFGYHLYSPDEKPKNKEFIALIAEKILKERIA